MSTALPHASGAFTRACGTTAHDPSSVPERPRTSMSAKKPTPVKAANIASFFPPKYVAAGAADAPALAAKNVSDDARVSVKPSGKLDFATVDPPPAAPEPASEAPDAATNPREPLATVADDNGVAPRAPSRRDSDLTGTVAGSNQQSPAASVGDAYHTPAVGLRAARVAESDMNSPIADTDAGAQVRALPPSPRPPAGCHVPIGTGAKNDSCVPRVAIRANSKPALVASLARRSTRRSPLRPIFVSQPIDSRGEAPSASVAPKSSAAIGASAVKSAADYAAVARDLEAKANEALAAIRDDAKLEAILADAKKPKPTTEPGRLMRRAENAKVRAEAEARKEEDRAAKAAAKEAERAAKEAEKVAKEAVKEEEKRKKEAERAAKEAEKAAALAAKEEEKRKKEAEKAEKAAAKEAEKAAALAAKEEEKRKKEAEKAAAAAAKEAAAAAEKAAKEAAAAARAEREAALLPDLVRYLLENPKTNKETATNAFCESRSVPEFELAKTSIRAKISDVAETRKPADRRWEIKPEALAAAGLTAEQAEAMRPALELTEEEKARERKRAEAAEKEAARKAEEAKAAARKAKQANAFKGFFAAAPKKRAVPEPAVTAPPAPAALDAAKEEALIAAIAYADADDAAAAETRRRDMLATWRNARRGVDSSGRWGQRRAPKRARGDGASSSADAALRAAMEASVAASGAAPRPKRRTLISVDCSSEYEESSSYRFGFQLGVDQLDGPHELRKTFPVPGGRPAYWGSGVPPGRPGSRSAAVTGRRPFARDPETEYEVDGALFDSGDEWEEEEEGENLDDSDADGDDEDERADRGEDEDDKEGFVVPDGYLSEEENAKGDDEILADADDAEDAEDAEDAALGLGLEPGLGPEPGSRLAPEAADDARAKRDRARAELSRWMDRARRLNRPLVIAAFARDAEGAAEGESAAVSAGAHLLQALAQARFRAPAVAPGTSAPPAIRMFRARRDGEEVASGAGLGSADAGGASKRRRLCDFPEEMTRALVEFLLASAPKMNKETATAAFAESRSDDATELAKTAVRAKIGDVAERNVNDRRWEIKPEALAAAGLTAEQAEAMRPALELTEEEKARAAKKAEKEAEKEARRKDAEEKKRVRDAAKAEKEAAKAAKAAAKATKAAGIAQALLKVAGGGAAPGAAAGAAHGAAANVARSPPATSPIKSLFDRAAAKATTPAKGVKPEETATAMDVDGEAPAV